MKLIKLIATASIMIAASVYVASCGMIATVSPATVGKILTKNGYLPETIKPSKFRLAWCWMYCDKLITADASDRGLKEKFNLFMPKDQLNMRFDVRMIVAIREDTKSIDAIFNRIPPNENDHISNERVYDTYVKPVIRDTIRSTIAAYSINEIASSRERINHEISQAVAKALHGVPMQIKRVGLAEIQFPDVITKQKEIAAQRRIEIDEAEAKKQIRLVTLQADLAAAKANRAIRLVKAQAAKDENAIYAASMSDKYLAYKQLEVLELMAQNPNTVFLPFKALDQVGLSQRLFSKGQ